MKTKIMTSAGILDVEITKSNTHIQDSYKVKKRKDMKDALTQIYVTARAQIVSNTDYRILLSNTGEEIREWRAHNLLYALGYKREQTGSVDLNNEPWYRRWAYAILSVFYPHK